MEYKIKATVLAFSLFVAITGSMITVEDWQSYSQERKVELIMTAKDLTESQKHLLLTVLQLEHDDLELQKLVERQAQEARNMVSPESSIYENEQWRQAARYFESSAKAVQDLRFSKKTYEELQKRYQDSELSESIKASIERRLQKQLTEVQQRGQALHDELLQAFYAIERIDRFKARGEEEIGLYEFSLKTALAVISAIIGFVIGMITVAKLVIDYRKSQIELLLLKNKAN
jgi:hypothetical protein